MNVGDDLLLTVTLSDAFGNTLEGIDPRNIDLGNHNANLVGWYEERDGDYSTDLTLTAAGNLDIAASINGHSTQTTVSVSQVTP
ncbi:invasin domain 3-containing protein [Providencia huaxiensis]